MLCMTETYFFTFKCILDSNNYVLRSEVSFKIQIKYLIHFYMICTQLDPSSICRKLHKLTER